VVFAGDLADDEYDAVALKLRVVVAKRAKLLHPRQLEIDKVIRVMNEPLPVGFVVADADFNFVIREHCHETSV
jgi:hypothetical protein